MPKHHLRFRQVHLDFHTSPHIPAIGAEFDKSSWQEALREGHVDSITCFSKCHHGWSYHPTEVGRMHPHLAFDLLRAEFEACKEIGVNVPVYLSAGLDDVMAAEHPEWREIGADGNFGSPFNPGFKKMCFNTHYLQYLCEQIKEAVRLFPNCDGIFLDIIYQGECCCKKCTEDMIRQGLDPTNARDRHEFARQVLLKYYRETTAAARVNNQNMPVFHNSGHVAKGDTGILQYFSHLELESLPTGGWGYDHFPMSAKYALQTGLDFLGMTGKFHTTWGEFGGYKHPNALRYECAAMIANGAKCSVGDQLHPSGKMDPSTYRLIGAAYAEVEEKEPWVDNVKAVADIAFLSSESETGNRDPDTGANRALLEEHFLFNIIDRSFDFSSYKILILPDVVEIDAELKSKIDIYLANGGKLLLTGKSGLYKDGSGFAFDIGGKYAGESEYQPDYVVSDKGLAPDFVQSPLVMYMKSQQVKITDGEALADIYLPYFNRTWKHYCSHQYAPASELSPYAAAVRKGDILYMAHPVFSIYYALGAVAYRQYVSNAIRMLLDDDNSLITNMPSTARINLMNQESENRYVLHLLYANTISRGASVKLSPEGYVWDSRPVEIIEDLLPLHNTEVSLQLPKPVKRITLEPQGTELPFSNDNGRIKLAVDEFLCHQMVVFHY